MRSPDARFDRMLTRSRCSPGITPRCDVVGLLFDMRNAVAKLLLVATMAGFYLPWLQAQTAAPACCRRSGEHHCAAPATQDGYHAAAVACPYRQSTPLTSRATTALPSPQQTVAIGWSARNPLYYSSPKLIRSYADTTPDRGPPSLT